MPDRPTFSAFQGSARIAGGELQAVAVAAQSALRRDPEKGVLVFDDTSGQQVDLDLRGSAEDVAARFGASETESDEPESARGRGRPKLGVVAREVTLLPRHWDWLAQQPGGASVALRKLVETESKSPAAQRRRAQEAANRIMTVLAGDRPGFEEATRALFAGDAAKFAAQTASWPNDVRDYATKIAAPAFLAAI